MPSERYIGIMSGTSMDAIDAALIEYDPDTQTLQTIGLESLNIPESLRVTLMQLVSQSDVNLQKLGETDVQLGKLFAQTANALLHKLGIPPTEITAIGSHGQTIRHVPDGAQPFSMQIGNPSIIAELTQITTVADFRMADMAAGGQGAPLVPAFHQAVFAAPDRIRAIVNIGGIANISILHPDQKNVSGYDIGPGNTLLDYWISKQLGLPYDAYGNWARSGKVQRELLDSMLKDAYLAKLPPKSTGREYFNPTWLEQYLGASTEHAPVDIQATLTEYTAQVIASSMNALRLPNSPFTLEVYLCGGGARNDFLKARIKDLLPDCIVGITNDLGIDVQMVEAAAFAWLAAQTMHQHPGNCPSATGARKAKILGGIYLAS